MAKLSDLQILRALLSQSDGTLSPSEKRAFQHMYDNVAAGMVIQLSKKQRLWLDGVYAKLKDDRKLQPGQKKVEVKDKQLLRPQPTSKASLLQRARALGLPDPVPEDKLPLLFEGLSAAEKSAIARRASEKGCSSETLALAYVKRLVQG